MTLRLVILGGAMLLAAGCGSMRGESQTATCNAEMQKFCKDVAPGDGRILKCLREHETQLSEACRAYANTASQYVACIEDILRLCPGTEPGAGQGLVCLRTHQGDLSTPCKNELRRMGR